MVNPSYIFDPDAPPSSRRNARAFRRKIRRKAKKYAFCCSFVAALFALYYFNTTATELNSLSFAATALVIALIGELGYFLTKKVLAKRKRLKSKLATVRITPETENEEWSLCALLSGLACHAETKEEIEQALRYYLGESEFDKSIKHWNRRPTPDNQDGDDEVDLPVISVVKDKKLYVAWQGTSSLDKVAADISVNTNNIGKCSDVFPNIKVHSGLFAHFHYQLYRLDECLEQLVENYDIEEVVFSGHSLGGGIAQIALMTMMGVLRGENCHKYKSLSQVEFRAKVFASPMVFSIVMGDLTPTEKDAIKEFNSKACNWFYGQDPIPRMPGHYKFWMPAVTQIAAEGGDEAMKESLTSKQSYLGNGCEALYIPQKYPGMAALYIKSLLLKLTVGEIGQFLLKNKIFRTRAARFRQIAKLIKVNHQTGESAVMSNDDFHRETFIKNSDKILAESHHVLPHCVGTYQHRRIDDIVFGNALYSTFPTQYSFATELPTGSVG